MKTKSPLLTAFKLLSTAALSSAVLTGCMSTTSTGYGAERKQFLVTTQNYAVKKAQKSTNEVNTARERSYHLPAESRAVEITNRLIPYANLYLKEDSKVKWDIFAYSAEKTNAGALADGTIAITYSMIRHPAMKNDDALAYLIAHEMAHVIRQHHRERQAWSYVVQPALLATAVVTAGTTAIVAAVAHDSQPFRRVLEKEADLLGLEIIAKAGYDPVKATKIFEDFEPTFKEEHPVVSRIPSFLSSHPSNKKRTKYTVKHIEKVMPLYDHAKTQAPLVASDPITPSSEKTIIVKQMVSP